MVDAALLELESVVFDTRELRRTSMRDALLDHGLASTVDMDVIDGVSTRAAASAALAMQGIDHDDVLIDLVALRAERAFSSQLSARGPMLRDGALDFVREASAVVRLAVVTRARRADVDTMLRLSSLSDFFAVVVAAEDALDAKPAADSYRVALDRLNRLRTVSTAHTIAIEDGAAGVRAARSAGVRCVVVGPLPAHVAMEADAYVASLVGQTIRGLDHLSRPGQERVQ